MRLKFVAATCAALGVVAVLAAPADAQTTKKRIYANRDQTVVVMRGEDGKTRTRVIIQKRSYLDPGPEVLPGSRHDLDYAQSPNHRATGILNNTVGGTNQLPLPGPFELGPRGPWLQY
ncbi:hypothetical protein ASD45_18570 [Pseudolabrys sp. Root1462]|jgi:hypothetical protein|uniref:hypothetical protein n=1 Tax=Pseudolabrys sp. Root1462 TaxID=1736466 RepID=UPI000702B9CC|nr:hypothetical protein [Pseudolabrys sp. Root1462]KQY97991.1 hypothetical protein ASD45_18570 [Pseudolabrys sp. Root1462]